MPSNLYYFILQIKQYSFEMSRIFVKQLPKNVTKEELSKHFAPAGQITDINLKFKKNGSFRRFAFIGFESEEAANEALKFNNTYIKTSKIIVDQCLDLDHKKKENINVKNEKQDFKYALKKKDEISKEKLDTLMQNPNFIQYLKLNKRGTADLVDTLKDKFGDFKEEEEGEKEEESEEVKGGESEEAKEEESEGEENEPKNQSLANRNISDIEA
ncbi:putative RNA-binding protein 19 [Armadillidium vulgare]|nr:putative RNA-binding protein 19 [Armadillidium vulgare]